MSAKPGKAGKKRVQEGVKVLVRNRRARHDYDIDETIEAGIALEGSEVKSLRDQRASIAEGHIAIRNREAWLVGVQIQEYPWAHIRTHAPTRDRKLLLHRREIDKLETKLTQRGYTLVPLAFYVKDGHIKLELGVARGKRQYEKRESQKEAEAKREIDRAMRRR
ncbi:MAG TPA: SsrA-binding protein SmpB [Kofleriaceae bacterium]|nr:SsrA-binding protein SmpB [Kofleriaceae bacterium]